MGIRLFSSSSESDCVCPTKTVYVECKCEPKTVYIESAKLANPDPENYKIISFEHIGDCLVVEIMYPNCKNFEGRKVLLYQNVKISDLGKTGKIDPHFNDKKNAICPVARFVPTVHGKSMAIKLAKILSKA